MASKAAINAFTSHIVKVKPSAFSPVRGKKITFTSHIVKVKRNVFSKTWNGIKDFTSHIVKVKPVNYTTKKPPNKPLHPT